MNKNKMSHKEKKPKKSKREGKVSGDPVVKLNDNVDAKEHELAE